MRTLRNPWLAAVVLLQLTPYRAGIAAQAPEYDIKAAYIFNLVNAVEWPPEAFPDDAALFRVCVAEPSPFGESLAEAFRNEQVGGHRVVVAAVRTQADVAGCHVLFVANGVDAAGRLQGAATQAPVLTIGESPAFTTRGGIITFVRDEGRIRLDVNQRAAESVRVKLSSKIMQVARRIL